MSERVVNRLHTRLAGAFGICVVLAAVVVTLGIYLKAFTPGVTVTVESGRAGLLLDKGAKVRVHGLTVGDVRAVSLEADGTVRITLAIKPSVADQVPADVRADISPTTVFGAKYVELLTDDRPVGAALSNGDVIQAVNVTTEANDVFAQMQDLLTTVDPSKLNTALTGLAQALTGRGDQLGAYFSDLNSYLEQINGIRPAFQVDVERGAKVLDTYADVAPALLSAARSFTVTSHTLDKNSAALQALLIDFTSAANVGKGLVTRIEEPLVQSLSLLRPVTDLGAEFSPALTCTIVGLDRHARAIRSALGAQLPGIQGLVSLLPGEKGYQFPRDLPKLVTNRGPACFSLPGMTLPNPPIRDFDDGQEATRSTDGSLRVGPDPVRTYLDLVTGFFGESGIEALVQALGGGKTS